MVAMFEPSYPEVECYGCHELFETYQIEYIKIDSEEEEQPLCSECRAKRGGDFSEERRNETGGESSEHSD